MYIPDEASLIEDNWDLVSRLDFVEGSTPSAMRWDTDQGQDRMNIKTLQDLVAYYQGK